MDAKQNTGSTGLAYAGAPSDEDMAYILYVDGTLQGIYQRLSAAFNAAEGIHADNIHILDEKNETIIEIINNRLI